MGLAGFLAGMTVGRLTGDRFILRAGPRGAFRIGALLAGGGWAAALLLDRTAAGLVGLTLLGTGISYLLPLLLSSAGMLAAEPSGAAETVARVSTLAYLGSFVGPGVIGAVASGYGLAAALAIPALLVGTTAFAAKAVVPVRPP